MKDLNKILEEIDVIYNGKKRNIQNITEEIDNIKSQFKNAETNNLLYKDYINLKDRQCYLEKRLPIEINELRGIEIARKILVNNINTKQTVEEEYIEDIRLTKNQMNIIANKFETTEWGWHGDGCNCGDFQIEIDGIGFLVVDRSCRKSSCTPDGMQYSFGNIIPVYNKSIVDGDNDVFTHDDFEEQGIVCIGDINREQTQIILEYARENTIRDLGYDEYGNETD